MGLKVLPRRERIGSEIPLVSFRSVCEPCPCQARGCFFCGHFSRGVRCALARMDAFCSHPDRILQALAPPLRPRRAGHHAHTHTHTCTHTYTQTHPYARTYAHTHADTFTIRARTAPGCDPCAAFVGEPLPCPREDGAGVGRWVGFVRSRRCLVCPLSAGASRTALDRARGVVH